MVEQEVRAGLSPLPSQGPGGKGVGGGRDGGEGKSEGERE